MNHKNITPSQILLVALLAVVLFPVPQAQALSISPLTFELVGNPGDRISNVLRITNDTDSAVGVAVEVEDFAAAGEGGQVVLESPNENITYSLARWVTVSPLTLQLGARDSATVEFAIDVPFDAEPGGHYSSVLATVSAAPLEGGGVGVAQRVGALLLLNVSGEVVESVRVVEFSAPEYSEYGPVTIFSRFENRGTVHLKPAGFILIKNIFGKEVERINLPQRNVLPNSIRRVEIDWGEKIMLGRYEATLTAVYGLTNEPVSAVTTFWVIPWKIAGGIGLAALILLILIYRGRRRLRLAFRILFKGHTGSL